MSAGSPSRLPRARKRPVSGELIRAVRRRLGPRRHQETDVASGSLVLDDVRLPADAVAGPARAEWGSKDPARAAHWSQRTAAYHGIVTWSPTVDPERLKLASQEMVLEEKVHLVFHSWVARPLIDEGKVRGAIFESKAGRQAVRAKVVVDATGDGDLFAHAGAAYESDIEAADIHHCMNTAWLLGGVGLLVVGAALAVLAFKLLRP